MHGKYGKHDFLYSFTWMIPRGLNFLRRYFETLCQLHLHRRFKLPVHTKYENGTECSENSAV